MEKPTISKSGSNPGELLAAYQNARGAITVAIQKLENAAPRLADYPPLLPGFFGDRPSYARFERAQAEHFARVAKLRQVMEDMAQLGIHVGNEANKGR